VVPAEVFPAGMVPLAHAMPSYWYAELGRDVAAGTPSLTPVLVLIGFGVVFAVACLLAAQRRPLHAVTG
jgi:ABC-2 type transport system permease protein